jgi:hypothetical protein
MQRRASDKVSLRSSIIVILILKKILDEGEKETCHGGLP